MTEAGVTAAEFGEPFRRFGELFERARQTDLHEPTAMALATADADGRPSVRMVLLKDFDEAGFVFYTNLGSRKAGEMAANPFAALCFHWQPMEVQVRIEGRVEPVTPEEADAYYASRARGSRIGAWASRQSTRLDSYDTLVERVKEAEARYEGREIPRPPFWSGFRVVPDRIEFWFGRPSRLHERELYTLRDGGWTKELLYP
ncbi:pyridoxamine 5'-phosphate oxidase [Longimicrobium sp.]|uniref:pyridoxamine 5'-phosphate oxidase n=1 Tax=Longimicrobium sp. TaxID=2029185 RepID=UPI002CDF153C|nr:pyridoxamine 5'-phosphate oxidase [Longimicrobium sp.]HSU13857.1 pyridoxamine 5'-phosphate oxidase [Longimicrobium sp.]